ncbi:hypothetical protein ACSS6W_006651 [Trichoderma asperelloides]
MCLLVCCHSSWTEQSRPASREVGRLLVLSGLRYDGCAMTAAGWTSDGAIVQVLEEKIASPASPVGLPSSDWPG